MKPTRDAGKRASHWSHGIKKALMDGGGGDWSNSEGQHSTTDQSELGYIARDQPCIKSKENSSFSFISHTNSLPAFRTRSFTLNIIVQLGFSSLASQLNHHL